MKVVFLTAIIHLAPGGRLIIARRLQRRGAFGPIPRPVGTPEPFTRCRKWRMVRYIPVAILLAALTTALGCSRDTPAATSKPPVTIDPDVFTADHPELFKTAKAELR